MLSLYLYSSQNERSKIWSRMCVVNVREYGFSWYDLIPYICIHIHAIVMVFLDHLFGWRPIYNARFHSSMHVRRTTTDIQYWINKFFNYNTCMAYIWCHIFFLCWWLYPYRLCLFLHTNTSALHPSICLYLQLRQCHPDAPHMDMHTDTNNTHTYRYARTLCSQHKERSEQVTKYTYTYEESLNECIALHFLVCSLFSNINGSAWWYWNVRYHAHDSNRICCERWIIIIAESLIDHELIMSAWIEYEGP